jgi:hypothetical protein
LFLAAYLNMRNLKTCQDPPNQSQDDLILFWAFHAILVTSFLVVFGDKVTKILRNSLFIFHFVLPILPCKRKTSYRKSRNLSDEKQKTILPKYVMLKNKNDRL